ncbi:MAG: aminotransferase class I/II-fold pyridoxal phosphate-dependent enzyme [Alphaproteobacteria bacterium]|nr:aminotransferase class I/II-fold pyridoxal phosphate-dependent enzyme [Alphaproteobacteria bacterium]
MSPMSQKDDITAFAEEKLRALEARSLRRRLAPTVRGAGARATRAGRELISFCDNDYLGLSTDPRVVAAAARAAREYGAGAGSARLITGDCPLNAALERKIAAMKESPACRLFGSGYLANIGVVPALVGAGDLIVMDELSHSCLHAGARLSGARIERFRHNDVGEARRALRERRGGGRALLLTETIFSMDGDAAPLPALAEICEETGAWLMTDDAHGFGVVKIDNPAPIQMGTLSKAVGAYGGYVCGPAALIDLLTSRARSFVYTTSLPPPVLGAALEALAIIAAEPERSARTRANAALFADLVGLARPAAAIVPAMIGEAARALDLSERLADKGFLVSAIRPPTVPEGTARLRFTFSAAHAQSDIRALAEATRDALAAAGAARR